MRTVPYDNGALLDALTGVDTGRATPLVKVLEVGDALHPLSLTVERKGIAVKDAQVLVAAAWDGGMLPVFTVRRQGGGKVYWLNSALEGHRAVHRGGAAEERSFALGGPEAIRRTHWELFDQVVHAAGIQPRSRFLKDGAAVFGQETWYYETPSGRTRWIAHHLDKTEGLVHVTVDRTGHVYEMRTGRYFGKASVIDDTFPAGCMRIYGVFDYRIAGLKAAAERPVYQRGEAVRVACSSRGRPRHARSARLAGLRDGPRRPGVALLRPGAVGARGQGDGRVATGLERGVRQVLVDCRRCRQRHEGPGRVPRNGVGLVTV